MIRTISSSLSTFKSLTFMSGLNILLADVAEQSTDRHTRNSAGKTCLVEIVHFILGGDANKSSIFKHEMIKEHSFSAEILLGDHWIIVTRSGVSDNIVTLSANDASVLGLGISSTEDKIAVPVDMWKALLGYYWFNIPENRVGTEFDCKGAPSFRSLISYFARRRKDGGFNTLEKSNSSQQPGSWQVSVSYLLGLDWRIAREFQDVRDRKRVVSVLSKAIKDGELGQIFGTTAEIRPELARVEERIAVMRSQVQTFQVHETYREQAARASFLKDRMSELTMALAEADSAVDYVTKSLDEEVAPAYADVKRLYAAAGIELPGVALRRFDDVKAFQESVSENRRKYLNEQIKEISDNRDALAAELEETAQERTGILQALDGKGAFEDLIQLRERLGELAGRAETLKTKLQHALALENNKTQLKAEAATLEMRLQQSYEASENVIKRATVLVDHAISTLYDDRTGNLIVEASRTGPKFRIDIQGGGNKGGIDMMKLFCFDTALLRISFDLFSPGPRMLIHDSHLFDGVDSRQVARAFSYGKKIAEEISGQYIVTLNSDEFERANAESKIPLNDFVNPVRLTDDEAGGLFGIRFNME